MLGRLRSNLTYANVMATIAVFGVLAGGTAYAANTIGSSDVINESLLSQDIRNGQVQNADLALNSVGSGRVNNDSLLSQDVKDATLTGGDVADDTLTGWDIHELSGSDVQDDTLTGADIAESSLSGTRLSGLETVYEGSSTDSASPKTARAHCPSGKRVIGTGSNLTGGRSGPLPPDEQLDVAVASVYPGWDFGFDLDSVTVTAVESKPHGSSWSVTAYAICATAE